MESVVYLRSIKLTVQVCRSTTLINENVHKYLRLKIKLKVSEVLVNFEHVLNATQIARCSILIITLRRVFKYCCLIVLMPSWHPWGILKIQDGRKKSEFCYFQPLILKSEDTQRTKIILGISWTFWKKKIKIGQFLSELRLF